MTIFVSIAAYRDPELIPTVEDALAKARHPADLRFGICWQRDAAEPALPWRRDQRFRIDAVDWRESEGACWARERIMRCYGGEDWYLQLDSHHRFVEGWDERLVRIAEATGSGRPVLTTYAAGYEIERPADLRYEPRRIHFGRWAGHVPLFLPGVVPPEAHDRPTRARFVSGHFCFSVGDFVRDVPYDPELYFAGEEISLSVRAFTAGYDLFHPGEAILWHEYTRAYRRTHWGDHREAEVPWHQRDRASQAKVARLLTEPQVGQGALGGARTLAEYEAYAGISFRQCRLQPYTRTHGEPPNPPAPAGWAETERDWSVIVCVDGAGVDRAVLSAVPAWELMLEDATGRLVHRCELHRPVPWAGIRLEIRSALEPAAWRIGPCGAGAEVRPLSGYVGRRNATGIAIIREPDG